MIYCFDIDGTICSSVDKSDYLSAKPYEDIINRINKLYDKGHTIKIMTARGCVSKKDYTSLTEDQLKSWGLKYHELIMNKKPHADIFIDDRAINIDEWRVTGEQITGLIAGTFDLIHAGYIKMFADAKSVCNYLIIALHEDPSIERTNKYKPVNTIEERTIVLSGLKYVDKIVVYKTEKELESLMNELKPNYRIVGSDYIDKKITGDIPETTIYYHNRNHDWSYSDIRKKLETNII